MKIDLHCHTKKVKNGEKEERNVDAATFCEKIGNVDLKIIAITNHNCFDIEQYNAFSGAAASSCMIWPGVELDVQESGGIKWHLVLIANPKNAEDFSNAVSGLFTAKDIETHVLSMREIYESLNKYDVIYIPHFHKKPSISEEDIKALYDIVGEKSRIFYETSDLRSLGVFANHDYSVLIGSDVDDWNNYEQSTFTELRLPVSSFEQFCLLAKRDNVVINTLLNEKNKYELSASPHKSVKFPLVIYEEMNIIFGQKGTGKSEILESLNRELSSLGKKCVYYKGTEKDDGFKKLLETKDLSYNVELVGAKTCEEEFSQIHEWVDKTPTAISKYFDWYKTKDNNKNKSKMKITESLSIPASTYNDAQLRADYGHITKIQDELSKINLNTYLTTENIESLEKSISLLVSSISKKFSAALVEKEAIHLTNYSIEKIKSLADKNSDTVSRPSNTGFLEFSTERNRLKKYLREIVNNITDKETDHQTYLGELADKGTIKINNKYRMLCEKSKSPEFAHGIQVLKDVKQKITKAEEGVFTSNIGSILSELKESLSTNRISSTVSFLGLSKQIVTDENNEYVPSSGEKGILLLQSKLNTDGDAYLLDEPELGMGNPYIDSNIRPQLVALAKQRKIVIVATHNANIAVRTLPYVSIYREHNNGEYSTYVGNPFSDSLININDPADTKIWKSESMNTLEGGKMAFYERKDIYESGKV